MEKHLFTLEGYEQLIKPVKATGNSGRVYLPTAWMGCRVAIIRLDDNMGWRE